MHCMPVLSMARVRGEKMIFKVEEGDPQPAVGSVEEGHEISEIEKTVETVETVEVVKMVLDIL
jgi:hypothetical protein